MGDEIKQDHATLHLQFEDGEEEIQLDFETLGKIYYQALLEDVSFEEKFVELLMKEVNNTLEGEDHE